MNTYLIHLRLSVTVWCPSLLIILTGFVFASLSCVTDLGFQIYVVVCLRRAVTGWTLLWEQSLVLIMRSCLLFDLYKPLTVFSGCWCEERVILKCYLIFQRRYIIHYIYGESLMHSSILMLCAVAECKSLSNFWLCIQKHCSWKSSLKSLNWCHTFSFSTIARL